MDCGSGPDQNARLEAHAQRSEQGCVSLIYALTLSTGLFFVGPAADIFLLLFKQFKGLFFIGRKSLWLKAIVRVIQSLDGFNTGPAIMVDISIPIFRHRHIRRLQRPASKTILHLLCQSGSFQ